METLSTELSSNDLFSSILEHERTYRGIHWMEDFFDKNGTPIEGFVESVLEKTFREIAHSKGPFDISAVKYSPDDANLLELIAFDASEFKRLSNLKGDALKKYLLELLQQLQKVEKELNKPTSTIDWEFVKNAFAVVGVIVTGVKGIMTFNSIITAGGTLIAALIAAMGTALAIAAITIIVVTLIAFVLVMLKDAREYHLVLNNTDYDLRIYEIYRHHGKVDIIPSDDRRNPFILARDLKCKAPYFFGGLFGLKKKNGALVGAEGVIQIDMYKSFIKHQTCTFLAYDVPLTILGGKNSCFVKCSVGNPSAKEFFNKNKSAIQSGKTESSDNSGNIKITKRINSQSGSESYALTTYEQI